MAQPNWQWETATAGAVAGFATVAAMYPLDIVRTRFQVNDGRITNFPTYKNTAHAIFTITRLEGLKGLYAGFLPAVLGSTVSWGLYFFFYGRAKQRYSKNGEEKVTSAHHLASAAEAGALVSLCTNPIWLIKTRLQLQNPLHQSQGRYSGIYDALRTIVREEGWTALYKGLGPGLVMVVFWLFYLYFYSCCLHHHTTFKYLTKLFKEYLSYSDSDVSLARVSHGAIQFTAYEELRRIMVNYKEKKQKSGIVSNSLNSFDYALLGGSSKIAAILITYPFQVIRTRSQQRPSRNGIPIYMNSWHVVKDTARFEGFRGFYKGITPNLLKNVPASSITFIVYENVLKFLRTIRRND